MNLKEEGMRFSQEKS